MNTAVDAKTAHAGEQRRQPHILGIKKRDIAKGMSGEEWATAVSAWPTTLIGQNSKLARTNFWQFTIPALTAHVDTQDGKGFRVHSTCPGAGTCAQFCYAQQGGYSFKSSVVAHTRNLQAYHTDRERWMIQVLKEIHTRVESTKGIAAFRVHDSGDFFSQQYLVDWCFIAAANPTLQFYAYTKMVPMVKKTLLPPNFTMIYSYGGKWDDLIDPKVDRHSKVFATHDDMVAAGYHDTTENDGNAADPTKRCIGLVYHGNKGFVGTAV